jgi:Fe-S-cluster containining protein
MTVPWYQDGLRFSCTRCGNCCTGAPGYVWINEQEVAALAEYLREDEREVIARYTRREGGARSLREKGNGDCVFYDREQGCTVYPVRPRQCRTWPFWESNVASPETWRKTCAVCPGSGQGDLVSKEEILERVKVIRL